MLAIWAKAMESCRAAFQMDSEPAWPFKMWSADATMTIGHRKLLKNDLERNTSLDTTCMARTRKFPAGNGAQTSQADVAKGWNCGLLLPDNN